MTRSAERPWLAALLVFGLLAAAGYAATEWVLLDGRLGFPLDDSWIHLQFARNLAAGDGLAYNPGERVSGSTAPLWTALLAFVHFLPGDPVVWTKLAGVLLYLAGGMLTFRLARELGLGKGLAALAAALALATSSLVWAALSGMEVPLFVALSLWGMVLHLRERRAYALGRARRPLALAVLALACLARPEGLLLLLLAVLDALLQVRAVGGELRCSRPPLGALGRGLLLVLILLAPIAVLYTWLGGSPLPSTFAAKAGAARRWLPDAQYLYTVAGVLARPQPLAVLLWAAGAVRLVAGLGARRNAGLLPALWVIALPLAYACLTPQGKHLLVGNFGRYFFPLFPPLVVLAVAGIAPAAARLAGGPRAGAARLVLRPLLAALLLAPTLVTLVQGAARYAQNVANVADGDVRMALWLRHRLPAAAVVAVQDIGASKYFLPNRVVDVSGIVSPEAVRHVRAAVSAADPYGERGMVEFLETKRPDYLVAFPSWYPRLVAGPGFRPLLRLRVPDNITLAADELVVYATPWTRYPLRAPAADRSPNS